MPGKPQPSPPFDCVCGATFDLRHKYNKHLKYNPDRSKHRSPGDVDPTVKAVPGKATSTVVGGSATLAQSGQQSGKAKWTGKSASAILHEAARASVPKPKGKRVAQSALSAHRVFYSGDGRVVTVPRPLLAESLAAVVEKTNEQTRIYLDWKPSEEETKAGLVPGKETAAAEALGFATAGGKNLAYLLPPEVRPAYEAGAARAKDIIERATHSAEVREKRAARDEARKAAYERLPRVFLSADGRAALERIVQLSDHPEMVTGHDLEDDTLPAGGRDDGDVAVSSTAAFGASWRALCKAMVKRGWTASQVDSLFSDGMTRVPSVHEATERLITMLPEADVPVRYRPGGNLEVVTSVSTWSKLAVKATGLQTLPTWVSLLHFGFTAAQVEAAVREEGEDAPYAVVARLLRDEQPTGGPESDLDEVREDAVALHAIEGDDAVTLDLPEEDAGEPLAYIVLLEDKVLAAASASGPSAVPAIRVARQAGWGQQLAQRAVNELEFAPVLMAIVEWYREGPPAHLRASTGPPSAADSSTGKRASDKAGGSSSGGTKHGRGTHHNTTTSRPANTSTNQATPSSVGYDDAKVTKMVEQLTTQVVGGPTGKRRNRPQRTSDLPPLTADAATDKRVRSLIATANESCPKRKAANKERALLPASGKVDEVMSAVAAAQVVIVRGETGSGKSTQVPQFLVERATEPSTTRILVTQPRRIAASGVASRVASEFGSAAPLVGSHVRGDAAYQSDKVRLLYATTGIALRRIEGDPRLTSFSHIVIDEVHERSADTDFLLAILRRLILSKARPDLKVILMSATLDAEALSSYFAGVKVRIVAIQGRTFPVRRFYLDNDECRAALSRAAGTIRQANTENVDGDADDDHGRQVLAAVRRMQLRGDEKSTLVAVEGSSEVEAGVVVATVSLALSGSLPLNEEPSAARGAVLVFLPGMAEISTVARGLEGDRAIANKIAVIPLHSSLSNAQQRAAFHPAPKGKRKVILATDIAEASITLPDVTLVVDAGRQNQLNYDAEAGTSKLVRVWASAASAAQRAGRAGRVAPGVAIHLYSTARRSTLPAQPIPELQRTALHSLCMRTLALGASNPAAFLATCPAPPDPTAVQEALTDLVRANAAQPKAPPKAGAKGRGRGPSAGSSATSAAEQLLELTPLGRHCTQLPLDVHLSKLVVLGALFGARDDALTLAAVVGAPKPLFVGPPFGSTPPERLAHNKAVDAVRLSLSRGTYSDAIAEAAAYEEWHAARGHAARREVAARLYLSHSACEQVGELRRQLVQAAPRWNQGHRASDSGRLPARLLKALLCGAVYPRIAQVRLPEQKWAQTANGAIAKDAAPSDVKFYDDRGQRVLLRHGSVNGVTTSQYGQVPFLSFSKRVLFRSTVPGASGNSMPIISGTSLATAYGMLLFAGGDIAIDMEAGTLALTDTPRIKFRAPARVGLLIRLLRVQLQAALQEQLEGDMSPAAGAMLRVARLVLESDGLL